MEMDKKRLLKAIDERCSRRSYLEKKIEAPKLEKLHDIINKVNAESGLNIQVIEDGKDLFKGFKNSYGMFNGVNMYFALVGSKNDKHLLKKIGYFGEIVVLECTAMGLGTCWIGGTYDKKSCEKQVKIGEQDQLAAVISVGYTKENKTLKEKIISGLAHRKTKTKEEMYSSQELVIPEEFIKGMIAVQKAPSAMNGQPVKFNYYNGIVIADVDNKKEYKKIDLGIAMLHFELGTLSDKSWVLKDDNYSFELKGDLEMSDKH